MTALGSRKHDATGRTSGKVKTRKNKISEQFIARPRSMMESPAYRVLTLSAHRILARLEVEQCAHGGTANGKLPVTYDDFERYGIARECVFPAINLCSALGFVEITERGRAGNAEFRKPNLYRLTYLATPFSGPTNEFQRIESDAEAKRIAKRVRAEASRDARRREKQKPSAGFPHSSVRDSHTESEDSIVRFPALRT